MRLNIEKLRQITTVFLEEELDYQRLTKAIKEYKDLLVELSGVELESDLHRKDIRFDNGIAIGTTWAAMCIDDIVRTRQFIRGTIKAIEDLLKIKSKPIHILYAGSGPFATLVLPLFSKYTEEEIQVKILEVNAISIENVNRVISKLGFDKYIQDIECEDATRYQIVDNQRIDLLISETMQSALVKEQQVPIMLNLINQLDEDVIVIPQEVRLDLALQKRGVGISDGLIKRYEILETLLEFNKSYVKNYFGSKSKKAERSRIIDKTISLPEDLKENYTNLVILTNIEVYGDEEITYNQSSLTLPEVLTDVSYKAENKNEIAIRYELEPIPRFEYELS